MDCFLQALRCRNASYVDVERAVIYSHVVDRSLGKSDEGSSSNAVGDEPWEQQSG